MVTSTLELLPALGPVAWYIFVMAATPGPNNAMLAASGMNFGVARTWPHIAGIAGGLVALLAACGLGVGVLFEVVPHLETALSVVAAVYLLYLAWRIANAAAPSKTEGARPLTFWEAFGFQFLNPKGWVMALTATTLMPDLGAVATTALGLAMVGAVVGTPSMGVWTAFGAAIARVFQNERSRRIINWSLALLLVATIPFMFR